MVKLECSFLFFVRVFLLYLEALLPLLDRGFSPLFCFWRFFMFECVDTIIDSLITLVIPLIMIRIVMDYSRLSLFKE